MKAFRRDPYHLLKYTVGTVVAFALADTLLLVAGGGVRLTHGISLGPHDALLPVLALLLCGLPSSLMHNCAHGNVGGRRLNRLVGELCGTVMLYGFEGFRLGHVFHHKYPDHPAYDPHPPRGLSFPQFLAAPVKQTLVVIETAYYEAFGRTPAHQRRIAAQKLLFNAGGALKLLFWALLLGPKLFLLLYLPMYLANIFVFAHINYATHVERPGGEVEIINLSDGLYYRLVNMVSFGGYFHKNHHLRPKAFHPGRVQPAGAARPLVTQRVAPAAGAAEAGRRAWG